jgi:hypothetical protein
MRGSIDLWSDDGDDRPGEGSAESSEIADDDLPALALNIPPGVSRNDIGDTIFEDDEEVSDELSDPPRRAMREDESASDIPGERADDTTEERDTNLEGDGRASSGLSPEQVEAAEKEFGDLIRGVRLTSKTRGITQAELDQIEKAIRRGIAVRGISTTVR